MEEPFARLTFFISSTIDDLGDEREKVEGILKELVYEVWRSESLGSPYPPLEECLRMARECNFFIGIYWKRYGTIPTGYDKSFPELEYDEAFRYGKRDRGRDRILVYRKKAEEGEIEGKLTEFLKKLEDPERGHLRRPSFEDADELKKHVKEDVQTLISRILRKYLTEPPLEPPPDKLLTEAENLFSELAKAKDISIELRSDHVKEKMLQILGVVKQHEQRPLMHALRWAIMTTMEAVKPELLLEVGGGGEDEIRKNLAEANQLHFYRKFVAAFAFQKMGFEKHDLMAIQVPEWQPNTLVRDDYAIRALESYSRPERCFVLTATLAKWLNPRERLRKAILGSKETRILLMSPFVEDETWSLFWEEFDAPVKPTRFLYPYEKDLFRRLHTIANNLYALSDLAKEHDVQVKLYTKYKPPLRFTLFPGKIATIFPTPYRLAGDLYTFCGKVTDREILQKLEDKYEEIWRGPARDVHLREPEMLREMIKNALHSYADFLVRKNLFTTKTFGQLNAKAKEYGPLAIELFNQLQEFKANR